MATGRTVQNGALTSVQTAGTIEEEALPPLETRRMVPSSFLTASSTEPFSPARRNGVTLPDAGVAASSLLRRGLGMLMESGASG